MNVRIDGSVVTVTKDGKTATRDYVIEAKAQAIVRAIHACQEMPDMTLNEFIDVWVLGHATWGMSANSLATCRSVLGKHVRPFLGDRPVKSLSADEIVRYIEDRYAEVGSYRSITPWVLRLQAVMSKAKQWGLIDTNPVMEIDALLLGGKPTDLVKRAS